MVVEGYAAVYDQPTVLWEYDGVQYKEVIARGAFDGADLKDVPFKYNHSDNVMIMARTRNKTLTLTVDEKGLAIQARLANTTQSRDLFELIKRGDIDKMSFAFEVQTGEYDRATHTRTIKKFKRLYDVAAVDIPAYDQTSISARSFFELEREKEQTLERETEQKRKRLIIKTYF
jgi:phage prohead protease, HK97 family